MKQINTKSDIAPSKEIELQETSKDKVIKKIPSFKGAPKEYTHIHEGIHDGYYHNDEHHHLGPGPTVDGH